MDSIVLELQRECLDPTVSIADILRKALLVSRKLGVREFQVWAERELNGYSEVSDLPSYRTVRGDLQVWDSVRDEWIPMVMESPAEALMASECFVFHPVAQIEASAKSIVGSSGFFDFPFPPMIERLLQRGNFSVRPTRHVGPAALTAIIDAVRTAVLTWTCRLEEDGILGAGMTFDDKEKERAAQSAFTINFHGPVGNSQIQQDSPGASQTVSITSADGSAVMEFVQRLKEALPGIKLDTADRAQLQAEIGTVEQQVSAPQPNHRILRECGHTIRSILEKCAGSILAAELLKQLPTWLGR
jgi:hypothetical protein